MVIEAPEAPFIAMAEIVTRRWWGKRCRRAVACFSGGYWVYADSGVGVDRELGATLNGKAALAALEEASCAA